MAKTTTGHERCGVIALDDLNGGKMGRNWRLAKAITAGEPGKVRKQCAKRRAPNLLAYWFSPSSKRCWRCMGINGGFTISGRERNCACGAHHDRDVHASITLRLLANSAVRSTETQRARSGMEAF